MLVHLGSINLDRQSSERRLGPFDRLEQGDAILAHRVRLGGAGHFLLQRELRPRLCLRGHMHLVWGRGQGWSWDWGWRWGLVSRLGLGLG